MTMRRVPVGTTALAVVFLCGCAAGQQTPPADTVGLTQEALRVVDLTEEIESTRGRPLRMRKLTLQPGGVLALHDHVNRPAVTYLLEGQMTYYRDGQPPLVVNPGEGAASGRATTHWGESTGAGPAVWIAVDIPQP